MLIDGYLYPPQLLQWLTENTHLTYINYGADDSGLIPFRMIEFRRADVFIEDMPWSRMFISTNNLDLQVLSPPLAVAPNVIGYRKGLAELRDQIDDSLKKRGQSFRDKLFLKYSGQPEAAFFELNTAFP